MTCPSYLEKRTKLYSLSQAHLADILSPETKWDYLDKQKIKQNLNRGIGVIEEVLEQGKFIFEGTKTFKGKSLEKYGLYANALGEIEKISQEDYYSDLKSKLTSILDGLKEMSKHPNKNQDHDARKKAYELFSKISDKCLINLT